MRLIGPDQRVKDGARPLLNLFGFKIYRDIDIEAAPSRPPKRCAMCGNTSREWAVVTADRFREVCPRCVEVVKDRTKNLGLSAPLLPVGKPGENTLWLDGGES